MISSEEENHLARFLENPANSKVMEIPAQFSSFDASYVVKKRFASVTGWPLGPNKELVFRSEEPMNSVFRFIQRFFQDQQRQDKFPSSRVSLDEKSFSGIRSRIESILQHDFNRLLS